MENYYDYNLTCGEFRLQLSNSLTFAEREIHPYHEILYCPDAHAILRTENRQRMLSGKNLLLIPKGQYHLVDPLQSREFPRLKIAIPDEIITQIPDCTLFSNLHVADTLNLHIDLLLQKISEALQRGNQSFYLTSAVTMLLAELSVLAPASVDTYRENTALMVRITEHISHNLSGDLSVRNLARIFSVSPSFLTHRFQKEVGISLHRYIIQKRMIYARERIDAGGKPTKIFADCGYKDYSSFYKAYCDIFSLSPSAQK